MGERARRPARERYEQPQTTPCGAADSCDRGCGTSEGCASPRTTERIGACGGFACGEQGMCAMFPFTLLGLLALRVPDRPPRRRASGPALVGVAAIRAYQKMVSPRLPTECRHTPTCSRYGIAALRRYGLVHGVRLTAGRISRCTADVPRGTHDPVP